MKITILGNNSALPAFGRHPTAQAVLVNGEMLLIDCGEGTQVQMQQYGIKWRKLHHIFISHLHGDHYFGLPGLINSMSLMGRTEPLHLHAPKELQPILDQILSVANTVLSYPLHFYALPEGEGQIVDHALFTVTCFPVIHRIQCHGFLIASKTRGRKIIPEKCAEYNIPFDCYETLKMGADYIAPDGSEVKNYLVTEAAPLPKRYAYCSDTLFTDSFLHLVRGVDALYHESTYLHADIVKAEARFHSTALQAAQFASMAKPRILLLGHFSSKYQDLQPLKDEAASVFPNVQLAEEGTVYEI